MAADELELTTDCFSYDVATLYASSFAGLMDGAVRHYLRDPARIGAYLETLPSYARPDKRAAARQSRYGPSSGSRTRRGIRPAVSRLERRLLKGAGQGVLASLNINAYPALSVAANRMTPCTQRVRDRYELAGRFAAVFRDTVWPGESASPLWSLPVLSLLPFFVHHVLYDVLARAPAGYNAAVDDAAPILSFDASRCSAVGDDALDEMGVRTRRHVAARPPFVARFGGAVCLFLTRRGAAQASLLQTFRYVGGSTIAPSLVGAGP